MVLAAISWLAYLSLLLGMLVYSIRHTLPATFAFSAVLLVQTGARPALFLAGVDVPQPQTHISGVPWDMMTVANCTILVWVGVAGLSYVLSKPAAGPIAAITLPVRSRPPSITLVAMLALVPGFFALALTAYLVGAFGGIQGFVYATKISKSLQGYFIIREAAVLSAVIAFYGLLVTRNPSGRKGGLTGSLFFAGLIGLNCICIYLWGVRYDLALLLLAGLFTYMVLGGKGRLFWAIVVSLGALFALQYLRDLRALNFSGIHGGAAGAGFGFWQEISNSLHLTEYDALMLALRDAGERFDFRMGADFWNGLVSWVPRFIYEDKETFNIGGWFRQVYQPDKINGWPVTVAGSWYVNFGFPGVLAGAALAGLAVRVFDTAYSRVRESNWSASVGVCLCLLLLDGGINTGFPQGIVVLVVPLWIVALALRVRLQPIVSATPQVPPHAAPRSTPS